MTGPAVRDAVFARFVWESDGNLPCHAACDRIIISINRATFNARLMTHSAPLIEPTRARSGFCQYYASTYCVVTMRLGCGTHR